MKILEQRKFLREKEVSDIYGINRNTLRRQRWGDYGIPYPCRLPSTNYPIYFVPSAYVTFFSQFVHLRGSPSHTGNA